MRRFLALALSVFTIQFAIAQEKWEMVKEKDGITIYNRKMEGSKLKEFKGTVKIKGSVGQVLNYLTNYKLHDKFIYKAKAGSVKMVKQVSDSDFYTYMIIATPWPASNRDVVTHYVVNKPDKNGVVLIDVSGVPDLVPEVKDVVRVPKMKGYWKLTPVADGYVEVTHQAYSSPGGNVPDGMANSASVDAPFYMLESLRKLIAGK